MIIKKYLWFLCFAVLLPVFASPVQAQSSRLYFAGYMGLNTFSSNDFSESTKATSGSFKMENAGSLAGAIGLRLTPLWRVEGEVSYRKSDMDRIDFNGAGTFKLGGDFKTWLWMANIYRDFDLKWKNMEPFATAGLGLAFHEGDVNDISGLAVNASDTSVNFAWQLGGGLKYRLSPDLALSGGYRYLGTTKAEIGSYEFDYNSHEFRIGIEYDIPVDFLQ